MNPIRPLAVFCLVGAVAACPGALDPDPLVDGDFATVTVYGRVLGPDGAPVALAEVAVEPRRPNACSQPYSGASSVTTGADGRYRATAGVWGIQHEVCLVVRAAPRPATGFAPDSVVRTPVVMRASRSDSLEVDFHLEAL